MLTIRFAGNAVSVPENSTVYEAASAAGVMTREVLSAGIGGEIVDLTHPLTEDCDVKLYTFEDAEGKKTFWHTASHILAQAVKRVFPEIKLTIGPAIDNGFYYDFDTPSPLTPDDLAKIETEMAKIVKENLRIERFTLPR